MQRLWTINGRFLTQKVSGVQRYAREILRALDQLLYEEHPLGRNLSLELLVPRSVVDLPDLKAIRLRSAGHLPGHFWEQFVLPLHARGGIISLCNTSTLALRKQIVCIHDTNVFDFPSSYSLGFRMFYRALLPAVAHRASVIVTVSQYSAHRLAARIPNVMDKLVIAPNGHEHVHRWTATKPILTAHEANLDTVLVIGSLAKHKNVGMLLKLAPELQADGIRIVVVGPRDERVFADADIGPMASNVVWLGHIPDDQLTTLLREVLCLAFPSVAEGFGLPPLEAMALGCPVVASDRASMPEVCGEAVLYASPDRPEEWRNAFLAIRNNSDLRNDLIEKGLARAARYSWRSSAELYLQALAHADDDARGVGKPE